MLLYIFINKQIKITKIIFFKLASLATFIWIYVVCTVYINIVNVLWILQMC